MKKKRNKTGEENPVTAADKAVGLFLVFCGVVIASIIVGVVLFLIGALWQIAF